MLVEFANVSGIRDCKRIPQTVSGIITDFTLKQLKARAGILIYSNVEFKSKDPTLVSGIHKQISNHWFTKSVDVTF